MDGGRNENCKRDDAREDRVTRFHPPALYGALCALTYEFTRVIQISRFFHPVRCIRVAVTFRYLRMQTHCFVEKDDTRNYGKRLTAMYKSFFLEYKYPILSLSAKLMAMHKIIRDKTTTVYQEREFSLKQM